MTFKQFVESQEGREHRAYPDADGYSIGVGHFLTKKELLTGIIKLPSGDAQWQMLGLTDSQIDELLDQDIKKTIAEIRPYLHVELTEAQMMVLVDFTFNEGIGHLASSTLLKKVNQGIKEKEPIKAELDRWVMSRGVEIEGLKNRRNLEAQIWSGEICLS